MYSNTRLLEEKLKKLSTTEGFFICDIAGYYMQFSRHENETSFYIEALSHFYSKELSALLEPDFMRLGFHIEDGNYFKYTPISMIDSVVEEVETIFKNLYKTDYHTPFEITEEEDD